MASGLYKNKHNMTVDQLFADEITSDSFIGAEEYKGTWAASTNTPTLADGTGDDGDYYIASDGGTVDFGAGNITFTTGDKVFYNGAIYQKIDASVTASEVPIADAGVIYTATETEGALQEVKLIADANALKTAIITNAASGVPSKIELLEDTDLGTDKVTIAAPTLTGDRAITIPDADVDLSDVNIMAGAAPQDVSTSSAPTFTADNLSDGGGNAIITTTQETNFETAYTKSGMLTSAASGVPAKLELPEDTDNGSSKVIFASPSALTSDRTITIPDADVDLTDVGLNNDFRASKNAASGVCPLDAGSKVPAINLPNSIMDYKGNWSSATNTPNLVNGTGNAGDTYVSISPSTNSVNFGAGAIDFSLGDYAVYNGTQWEKSINSNAVQTVFGRTGAVVATTDDYTWAQITKTVSDIADITTKSHTSLSDIGSNTHAQIDTSIIATGLNTIHTGTKGINHDQADLTLFGATPSDEDIRAALWANGDRGIGIGSGGNIYSMYNYATGGANSGFQDIYNSEGTLNGATSLPDGTYHLNVDVDGAGIQDISVTMSTEDISDLATDLHTELSGLGTSAACLLTDGRIRISSDSTGVASTISITDGSGDDGGVIAMLTGLGSHTAVIDTAVDGQATGSTVMSVQLT